MSRIGSKFGLIGSGSAMGGGGGIYPPAGKISAFLDTFLTLEANAAVVKKAQATLDVVLDSEPQAIDFKAVGANLDIVLDSDATAVSSSFAFGNALQFDGINDNVQFTTTGAQNTWVFSAWVKTTTSGKMIVTDGQNSGIYYIQLYSTFVRVRTILTYDFDITGGADGNWHHLGVTSNSGVCNVYFDGVVSTTGAKNIGPMTFQRLGSRGGDVFFAGTMDEIGLDITTAADASEMLALYNSGNGSSFLETFTNAYFNYHLDESGTDTTAADASSNNNDGTLVNFPTSGMWQPH